MQPDLHNEYLQTDFHVEYFQPDFHNEYLQPDFTPTQKSSNKFVLLSQSHQIFITKSYDATTHFETCCQDIKDVYERATGLPIDFSKVKLDVNVGQE